jgi:hypothetical protein
MRSIVYYKSGRLNVAHRDLRKARGREPLIELKCAMISSARPIWLGEYGRILDFESRARSSAFALIQAEKN